MATETQSKSGIWTQHQDASGRTFYFNMVHGRSYWEIPDELKAHVKRPVIDTLRERDPAFHHAHSGFHSADDQETRRRREQVMQHAASASSASVQPGMTALHERMAQAAQRKKEAEMKRFVEEKQRGSDRSDAASSNAYLEMVRQLQHVDKETESTGAKWLVR